MALGFDFNKSLAHIGGKQLVLRGNLLKIGNAQHFIRKFPIIKILKVTLA